MGLYDKYLNKSLFNADVYKTAIDAAQGYGVIRIEPTYNPFTERGNPSEKSGLGFIGVMQNNVTFDINATYTEGGGMSEALNSIPLWRSMKGISNVVDGVMGIAGGIQKFANNAGVADIGLKYSTRKIYHRSGYLQLHPKIRVVDWEGTEFTNVVFICLLVASYCVPSDMKVSLLEQIKTVWASLEKNTEKEREAISKGVKNVVKNGVDMAKDVGGAASTAIKGAEQKVSDGSALGKDAVTTIDKVEGKMRELCEGVVDLGGDVAKKVQKIGEDAGINQESITDMAKWIAKGTAYGMRGWDDYFKLRAAPTPVRVRIGNFFFHEDMIIESVSFDFSKEMTKNGPLYVDISMSLSSRTVITSLKDVGLTSISDMGTFTNQYINGTGLQTEDEKIPDKENPNASSQGNGQKQTVVSKSQSNSRGVRQQNGESVAEKAKNDNLKSIAERTGTGDNQKSNVLKPDVDNSGSGTLGDGYRKTTKNGYTQIDIVKNGGSKDAKFNKIVSQQELSNKKLYAENAALRSKQADAKNKQFGYQAPTYGQSNFPYRV